jgi:putative transposase
VVREIIRTTNPIESTFARIRLRHRKTKNNGSAKASLVMIFKLAQSAAKGWRKLRGHQHIPELIRGVRFIDGVIEQSADELKSSATNSPTTHTEIVA